MYTASMTQLKSLYSLVATLLCKGASVLVEVQ